MYDELCKIWKRNGIDAFCFENKEDAADFLCSKLKRIMMFSGTGETKIMQRKELPN